MRSLPQSGCSAITWLICESKSSVIVGLVITSSHPPSIFCSLMTALSHYLAHESSFFLKIVKFIYLQGKRRNDNYDQSGYYPKREKNRFIAILFSIRHHVAQPKIQDCIRGLGGDSPGWVGSTVMDYRLCWWGGEPPDAHITFRQGVNSNVSIDTPMYFAG